MTDRDSQSLDATRGTTDEPVVAAASAVDAADTERRLKASFEKIGYSQLNAIQCKVEGTEVVLTGVLDSFYLKQVAQSVAVKVTGIQSVRNEVEVQ